MRQTKSLLLHLITFSFFSYHQIEKATTHMPWLFTFAKMNIIIFGSIFVQSFCSTPKPELLSIKNRPIPRIPRSSYPHRELPESLQNLSSQHITNYQHINPYYNLNHYSSTKENAFFLQKPYHPYIQPFKS